MRRLIFFFILLGVEAVAIVALYQVFSDFECWNTDVFAFCRGIRLAMVLGLCVVSALILLLVFQPRMRVDLIARAASAHDTGRGWAGLHLIGLALIAAPAVVLSPAQMISYAGGFLFTLALGGGMALLGGVLWLMPAAVWWGWGRTHARLLLPTCAIALAIPIFAWMLELAWDAFEILQAATFLSVAISLGLLGNDVFVDLDREIIGIETFFVEVAESCSGIEGLALTTAFMAIYAMVTKDDLRMGRFWGLVWPLALSVSAVLNIVRISGLILIGAYVSPELAVNGFHSFAGWLSFTLVALLILTGVNILPGLSKSPSTPRSAPLIPLSHDKSVAFIVPFLAFMLSGLLVNTFSQRPEIWYGVQVLAMALALWVFRKPILALTWDLDWVALGAGTLIGVAWIITAEPAEPYASLVAFGAVGLVVWIVLRVIGTALLVPLVEELFFRGYLFSLIDDGSYIRRGAAIALSTAAFAALHSRPIAAAVAGVIFAAVMLRRGRVMDAIVAHAVANALIAAAALATGQWALI